MCGLVGMAVAVFLVTWIVIGSAASAAVVVGVVLMIVVDMVGVMAVWRISLNAVSLVNLVMALGISVEFCSHLTRAFTISSGTRHARATFALVDVGASVRWSRPRITSHAPHTAWPADLGGGVCRCLVG
jgi:Niemann-Pick C1 protein